MTRDDIVARARSVVDQGCKYALSHGGMHPERAFPWDQVQDARLCDCSGFAMWALGLSRLQGAIWYDTTRIVDDALGRFVELDLFDVVALTDVLPGDLLVYPDAHQQQGHVGIVVVVPDNRRLGVVHCSHGNERLTGDAIRETDASVFIKGNAIVARFKGAA